eukprot:213864_1
MMSITFVFLTIHLSTIFAADYVLTPHGKRLKQCVHTAEEYEAVLTDKGNGVEVFYPVTNRTIFHPALPECIEEAKNIRNLYAWQDNAYDSSTPAMGTFYSAYNIPDESPPNKKQLLYFFIGMVNFGGTLGETIIQPVVNYDQTGQYPTGWSMESWNCCPSGQSHTSKNIKLKQNINGIPTECIADGQNINVTMSYGGQSTTLVQKQSGRTFKYIDATLEEYGVNSQNCDAFTSKVFNFTNMKINDATGKAYTPNWVIQDNAAAKCKGQTIQYDKFNIGIIGNGE